MKIVAIVLICIIIIFAILFIGLIWGIKRIQRSNYNTALQKYYLKNQEFINHELFKIKLPGDWASIPEDFLVMKADVIYSKLSDELMQKGKWSSLPSDQGITIFYSTKPSVCKFKVFNTLQTKGQIKLTRTTIEIINDNTTLYAFSELKAVNLQLIWVGSKYFPAIILQFSSGNYKIIGDNLKLGYYIYLLKNNIDAGVL